MQSQPRQRRFSACPVASCSRSLLRLPRFVLCAAALAFKTKYDECRVLNAANDKERIASPAKADKPTETA